MNNYTTIGNYCCGTGSVVSTLQNAPFTQTFQLKVEKTESGIGIYQTFKALSNGNIAYRYYNGSSWSQYVYFSDDATVLGQTINASDILTDIISDISEMDDINKTCIRYVQGALLEGKSIYGFVLTAKAGTVLSQIIFGSFTGVSGIAVRGKSGSPIQWKDWKIL